MFRKRQVWLGILVAIGVMLIFAAIALAQSYDTYNWTVQNHLGIGLSNPNAPLHVSFGPTGEILAATPLGNGPGWLFNASNGHRRDITAWVGGLYIGVSPNTSAPSPNLVICENGNVGVGYTGCPNNIFAVVRNSPTDPIADNWTYYSSRTYKTDIQELSQAEYEDALQSLLDTSLVHFRYQGQDETGKQKLGVIAEEAPPIILAEGDPRAVSLNEYVSLLHAAIKAQQAQIEAQQQQIELLQATVDQLKK